jgi:hypothetical protein
MRGTSFAALAVPVAAMLLFLGHSPDAPAESAEAHEIDQALAKAESDLARARASQGSL